MTHNCIGLLEMMSVAAGIEVCDAMVKTAPIELLDAKPVCPGKYLVMVAGSVASVESAMAVGRETAAETFVDELFLPKVHEQVIPAILRTNQVSSLNALGIIETFSVAAGLWAADAAAKAANVTLVEARLAGGLAGKAFVTMVGEVADVEAGVAAGASDAAARGMLVRKTVIPNPDEALSEFIL
ncbi:BMC domain-containing protein [Candidatus Hydrogenedentota bacterium]